jgi:hypothetical protein
MIGLMADSLSLRARPTAAYGLDIWPRLYTRTIDKMILTVETGDGRWTKWLVTETLLGGAGYLIASCRFHHVLIYIAIIRPTIVPVLHTQRRPCKV